MKEVNKKELAVLLGKSYNTIRKWDDKKIEEELLKKCWKIVDTHKTGNKVTFNLEYEEQDFNMGDYVEEHFQVRNSEQFVNHTEIRFKHIEEDKPITKHEISRQTGNSVASTYRYDSKLVNKNVLSTEGYYYVKREKGNTYLVSEEEYEGFWRENFALKVAFRQLGKDVEEGEITAEEYAFLYDQLKQRTDIFYYRVRKYAINKGHEFYHLLKL